MNKTELVDRVSEKTYITKKDTRTLVDAVFETIQETLARSERVQIMGFGAFETRERAARKGRNPQTGEEMEIPERVAPAFKAGKTLKDAVEN